MADTSPGRRKLGNVESAILWRPAHAGFRGIPPHHTGTLLSWHTSCTFLASLNPPTPADFDIHDGGRRRFSTAAAASRAWRIDSSRQMAVFSFALQAGVIVDVVIPQTAARS